MNKKKIINDPVYGFIRFPYEILYDLIDHPAMQRLRRISQLGLGHLVYPGAMQSRLHHAMGALHLMTSAIQSLREKEVEISEEEAIACSIGILLHDIGHGPFSHALEKSIINVSHEFISLQYMEMLNEEFDGQLSLAIRIFKNEYERGFFHELISSQLDVDRMDYLNRDSYYTGVSEGTIGYDRIIAMLNVVDDELVIEEKGIFSVEKFLMARRLMYWQVYLHKTSLVAEQMLIKIIREAKTALKNGDRVQLTPSMEYFMSQNLSERDFLTKRNEILEQYSLIDDYDIYFSLKMFSISENEMLKFYSKSILDRKLMQIVISDTPISEQEIREIRNKILEVKELNMLNVDDLILIGKESNLSYNTRKETIKVLKKSGEVIPITQCSENLIDTSVIIKHFLCFPKILS